jgi:hypothetical protein
MKIMRTIWKYQLEVADLSILQIPKGGKILCVQTQNEQPCIWVDVDSEAPTETRWFKIFGTGHQMGIDERVIYIGTFQLNNGSLVFHLFEV